MYGYVVVLVPIKHKVAHPNKCALQLVPGPLVPLRSSDQWHKYEINVIRYTENLGETTAFIFQITSAVREIY